ncbi:hypothetical protein LQT97_14905 [Brucella pseudogrignonensis]|uniref:hypothetical protein n=1 Tax=Brucella pseudogrignonensis TaxID=419475 RepID=UPI001E6322DF|nr:hypothetical protein [Brucella pseudogrignonensis]MCD4512514.1 hypothetical protein [Brucella pseudogrignonensis]
MTAPSSNRPFKDYVVEDDRILSSETTLGLGDRFVQGLLVFAALALAIGFYSWVLS